MQQKGRQDSASSYQIKYKGRFLLIPMQNDSLIRPNEKGFGGKREDLTPWLKRPHRNTPTTEERFWVH